MKILSGKLEQLLLRAVDNEEIAGANILVLKEGKEIAYAQAGYADRAEKKSYERDTIARLYSMTKPVTAAAAMLLMERGLLDPGAFVEDFLPGFHDMSVAGGKGRTPARRPMRICELLNMTSGLVYGGDTTSISSIETEKLFHKVDERLPGKDALTTVEIANSLGLLPLAFHPGDSWQYGTSADVLGAVIEVICGVPFGEFLKEEFFNPLGMQDTGFYVPQEKQGRLAKVYERTADGLVLYTGSHLGISNVMKQPPAFESGGAGLASTLDDYEKFASMLLAGGSYAGGQLMKPQTVRYMTQAKLLPWQQDVLERGWDGLGGHTYANLLRIVTQPGKTCMMTTEGEYGWDGWLGAYFANSPKDKLTMLLTFQLKDAGTTSLTRRLKNAVWSELC
ncbi:CubicO group peptidase (beta-lactamase class C family) [Kineothrix alysoides]|uniref:CubicO group peptidase (Beta-lactamase class C family) n=1 Tax=Kineothrix alysoides TaxID=1469948 RepID=A0A4V2QBM9_9FIRM|nr:serine hydrolase domain-containing protein [Kineothrix alysoides]TCL57002.1 CubicO group peptidase (beta-lactamase class C family) [Kineothrix alysoides]